MCHLNQNTLSKKIKYSFVIFGILVIVGLVVFCLNIKRIEPTFNFLHQLVWVEHFATFFVGVFFGFSLFYSLIFKAVNKKYWVCFLVVSLIFLFFAGISSAVASLIHELNDENRPLESKIDSCWQLGIDLSGLIIAFVFLFIFYKKELKLLWSNR